MQFQVVIDYEKFSDIFIKLLWIYMEQIVIRKQCGQFTGQLAIRFNIVLLEQANVLSPI